MSGSDVTKEGLQKVRPGREALIGASAGRNGSRAAIGRSYNEQMSVATKDGEPAVQSYYGKPIINAPVWESPDIPGYLYLGGLAGASSVLGLGAQLTGRASLARPCKYGAAGAAGLSILALVHDLGRPERFLNMLRVLKPTSPMSVGSWLLSGYGSLATAAAASEFTGVAPALGTAASAGAALLGPAVASYTAALISNTAVPAWHEGYREMPFLFVSSAASAAGGLGLMAAPVDENGPARRLAVAGTSLELALSKVMEKRMGMVGESYHGGKAGALMKAAEVLGVTGTAAALLSGRSRLLGRLAGAALLSSSACTRFGIFHAGLASARDPKYTVVPQRERLAAREAG
jgi:formate-dependent nitrite reductase membrane component NrfD